MQHGQQLRVRSMNKGECLSMCHDVYFGTGVVFGVDWTKQDLFQGNLAPDQI